MYTLFSGELDLNRLASALVADTALIAKAIERAKMDSAKMGRWPDDLIALPCFK